jgi:hypothetical protein
MQDTVIENQTIRPTVHMSHTGLGTKALLTINVPVVYMGRDVWIWMRGNP